MTPLNTTKKYNSKLSRPERRAIDRIRKKIQKRGIKLSDVTVMFTSEDIPYIAFDELENVLSEEKLFSLKEAIKENQIVFDMGKKVGIFTAYCDIVFDIVNKQNKLF